MVPPSPPEPAGSAAPGSPSAAAAFRRPIPPAPIERYDLPHPAVPERLDGLTILHITDLHTGRRGLDRPAFRRLLDAVASTPVDLVALTGDYMSHPGDEPAALRALAALAEAWRARLGAFGIFGNHDSAQLMRAARQLRAMHWLENRAIEIPGLPLRLIGASFPEDLLGTVLSLRAPGAANAPAAHAPTPPSFPLTLLHHPTELFAAADLGLPIILAGHTHGGQIRLSPRFAPHTSCELPPHLASGILRLRATLCCISRGVGCAFVGLRLNCPPQIPLYTLRAGPLPGRPTARDGAPTPCQVVPW